MKKGSDFFSNICVWNQNVIFWVLRTRQLRISFTIWSRRINWRNYLIKSDISITLLLICFCYSTNVRVFLLGVFSYIIKYLYCIILYDILLTLLLRSLFVNGLNNLNSFKPNSLTVLISVENIVSKWAYTTTNIQIC